MNKPRITEIRINPEDPAWRDLYADGAFFCTLPLELVLRRDLAPGTALDNAELDALTFEAELIPAREKAYQLLGCGDQSRKRLAEKLQRAGFSHEVIEAVCDRLEERDYLNDARLAARLAKQFAEEKRWGPRRILPELTRRGIPAGLAREAVSSLDTDFNETARAVLQSKYRGRDLTGRAERNKVFQGLARFGFDFDTINHVLSGWDEDDTE